MNKLIQETKAGRVSLEAYQRVQKAYGQAMVEARRDKDQEALQDATMGFNFASLFVKHYETIVNKNNPKV